MWDMGNPSGQQHDDNILAIDMPSEFYRVQSSNQAPQLPPSSPNTQKAPPRGPVQPAHPQQGTQTGFEFGLRTEPIKQRDHEFDLTVRLRHVPEANFKTRFTRQEEEDVNI